MSKWWYVLHPRYWINYWKAVRFVTAFGPDQAEILTKDMSLLDTLEVAAKNWFALACTSLPHRYEQLLKRIQAQGNLASNHYLIAHVFMSAFLVPHRIRLSGMYEEVPFVHMLIWEQQPEILEGLPKNLADEVSAFKVDFEATAKYFYEAYYWSQKIEEIKQQLSKTART